MTEAPLTDPGEKLLWSGRPNPAKYAFTNSWAICLFGILFFGLAAFWTYHALSPRDFLFALFGIPFLVIAAGMILSPLWHLFRGKRTTYALTDRRALTTISAPFSQRLSVPLRRIGFTDVRAHADGSGDILFKETVTEDADGRTVRREGFVAIADVARVERMLRAAIDKAVPPATPS